MNSPSVRVSFVLPVSAERLYRAWLDPKEHAAFTGGAGATSQPKVGGGWTAFDGYASGTYVELTEPSKIAMSWRAEDFPEGADDSHVEVLFQPASGGTRVTILHAGLPVGHEEHFRKGWSQFYEAPMRAHFHPEPAAPGATPEVAAAPAAKRRARAPKAAAEPGRSKAPKSAGKPRG